MDPLSGVLSLLKPHNTMCGGLMSVRMVVPIPQHEGIKCYAVVSGQCWLSVEGVPGKRTEDRRLLSCCRWDAFPPRKDLALPPLDFRSIFTAAEWWRRLLNGERRCSGVGGYSALPEITPASCWECSRPSCISRKNRINWRCAGLLRG